MIGSKLRFLVLVGLAAGSVSALAHEHHSPASGPNPMDRDRPPALAGESIYNLDDSWESQDRRKVPLSSLVGKPTVIAMLYTSCQAACPMTIVDMKRIESGLSAEERAKVAFAVFSFDPKRDTPEKLAEFAKARGLDPARWTLYHGSKTAVRKLAAVLGIQYKEDATGNFDHSNVITLVDAKGVIRHQRVGLGGDAGEMIVQVREVAGKK